MASAKDSLSNAAPVLAAGAAGAAAGHFAGKGKNLLLGTVLLLGAPIIASVVPVKALNATNLRIAGAVCLLVTPSAPAGSNQSLADFAKDGLNRIKGFANATIQGAGVAKGPFKLGTGSVNAIPVEGYGYVGETPYEYAQFNLESGENQELYPQMMGELAYADPSNAGR